MFEPSEKGFWGGSAHEAGGRGGNASVASRGRGKDGVTVLPPVVEELRLAGIVTYEQGGIALAGRVGPTHEGWPPHSRSLRA